MKNETLVAIIAASSAISGGLIVQVGSFFHSLFDRKNKRDALLREKLEELADNIQQTVNWCDSALRIALPSLSKAHGLSHGRAQSPPAASATLSLSVEARRVYVLALIYFPDLRPAARRLLNASATIYSLLGGFGPLDDDELSAAANEFSQSISGIDDLVAKTAKNTVAV